MPEAIYYCWCATVGTNTDNDDYVDDEGATNHQVETCRGEYWSSGKILKFLCSPENLVVLCKQNVTSVELLLVSKNLGSSVKLSLDV